MESLAFLRTPDDIMYNEAPSDDLITFVIQGPTMPVDRYPTDLTIASVRAFFPGSRVVVSTWEEHRTDHLSADEVVLNRDPGPITDGDRGTVNNINRQIVSTREGLARVGTPFAVKLRSDALITGRGFLSLPSAFPLRSAKGRLFESRIVIPREFTRSPRSLVPLAYHPSDLFHFGLTVDLRHYWSAPLLEGEALRGFILENSPTVWYSMFDRFRFTTEQYLFLSALCSGGLRQKLIDYSRIDDEITSVSEHLLFNNFIPCEAGMLGVRHSKFAGRTLRSLAEDCVGIREFTSWYVEQVTERSPLRALGDTTPHMSLLLRVERFARELLKKSSFLRYFYATRYLDR